MKKTEQFQFEYHPDTDEIILSRYIALVELHNKRKTVSALSAIDKKERISEIDADMDRILTLSDLELNGLKALALQLVYEKHASCSKIQ